MREVARESSKSVTKKKKKKQKKKKKIGKNLRFFAGTCDGGRRLSACRDGGRTLVG
jgi:hypothetical protein